MPKSKIHRWFLSALSFMRVLFVAWMVGIANSINQEAKFMDDTNVKTELVEEQEDDEPLRRLRDLEEDRQNMKA